MTASFDFIRYAAVWEDADVLLQALALQPGASVLCICSAGDNALSLLATDPERVVAVDLSLPQLHLAALKKAAFQVLRYDELLLFLGDAGTDGTGKRLALYQKLRPALSTDAARFWDARQKAVSVGILEAGKFERYFAAFRRWALPLVHSRRTTAELLRPKTEAEQARFYQHHWNTWRWQALLGLFFSRFILGRYGRDPAFLEHVQLPVGTYIRQQAEAHLQSALATKNPFLHRILTGRYGSALPHYLRPEHFERIRSNLHRLAFRQQSADAALQDGSYNACALSNIFEYMSEEAFADFVHRVTPHLPAGAKLAFWNLMVPRAFSTVDPGVYRYDAAASAALHKQDTGFFYSRFLLETRL